MDSRCRVLDVFNYVNRMSKAEKVKVLCDIDNALDTRLAASEL